MGQEGGGLKAIFADARKEFSSKVTPWLLLGVMLMLALQIWTRWATFDRIEGAERAMTAWTHWLSARQQAIDRAAKNAKESSPQSASPKQ